MGPSIEADAAGEAGSHRELFRLVMIEPTHYDDDRIKDAVHAAE